LFTCKNFIVMEFDSFDGVSLFFFILLSKSLYFMVDLV
jgi:hypothetical protein